MEILRSSAAITSGNPSIMRSAARYERNSADRTYVGKLIKVAAGGMNTHSRQADCRMEVFGSHMRRCRGADPETVKKLWKVLQQQK